VECYENISKIYLGNKSDAFMNLWNQPRFRGRICLAGGSVLLGALANTGNLTHVHRDATSQPSLPVDIVNYGGTDLDMFFLRDWTASHAENERLLRDWCVHDAHSLRRSRSSSRSPARPPAPRARCTALADVFSDDPTAHTLWLNGATFSILRCGAPHLQVVLRICNDVNFVMNFDLPPCRFVLTNESGLSLGATFEAIDAVTTRSFVAREGMQVDRIAKYVLRGFAMLVPRDSSPAWMTKINAIALKIKCGETCRPVTFGTSDADEGWNEFNNEMANWATKCSEIGREHAGLSDKIRLIDPLGEPCPLAPAGDNFVMNPRTDALAHPPPTTASSSNVMNMNYSVSAPPPPPNSMWRESESKHFCAEGWLARNTKRMRQIADVGYIAYAHAAGSGGLLRVEDARSMGGSGMSTVAHFMFESPKVPQAEFLFDSLEMDDRGADAMGCDVARMVRKGADGAVRLPSPSTFSPSLGA